MVAGGVDVVGRVQVVFRARLKRAGLPQVRRVRYGLLDGVLFW